MLNFIRGHQNLEKLSIRYFYSDDLPVPIVNYYVPNVDLQLLKLKFLFCRCRRVLKGNDKFYKVKFLFFIKYT